MRGKKAKTLRALVAHLYQPAPDELLERRNSQSEALPLQYHTNSKRAQYKKIKHLTRRGGQ